MKKIYLFFSLLLAAFIIQAQPCTFTPTWIQPNQMVINPPAAYPSTDYNFNWDFGDGSSINTNSPNHIYAFQGTYVVTLTVYDNTTSTAVCSSTTTVTPVFCDTHFQQDTASPANFNFWATLTMGNTAMWDFGDGVVLNGDSVSHTYAVPGTYTVALTQLDPTMAIVCVKTFMVAYNPALACSFDISQPTSNLQWFVLNALVPTSEGTVTWDFDAPPTPLANGHSVGIGYGDTIVHNVCMYFTTPSGYSCQSCQQLTPISTQYCQFTNVSDMIDMNLMHFTATNSTSGTLFVWDFGDGTTASTTSDTISHYYTIGNFYMVTMNVIDTSTGSIVCSYSNWVAANVNGYHCNANFTSVSAGLNAYFINQVSSSMPGPVVYNWDFGDGYTSSVPYPQHQYATSGTYNVCLNVSTPGWGCNDTFCDTIVIDSTIVNPTGCSAYFVFTQTASFEVVAVNLSSGSGLSFAWDFGDGTVATGPYPTHQYTNTGTYNVCLTVADGTGCTSTYCDTLTVDANGNISYRGLSLGFVLNIVSPVQITGISKPAEEKALQIYPVPAHDYIYADLDLKANVEQAYEILSTQGNKVMTGFISKVNTKIGISKLTNGMYLLRLLNADGSATNRTFIKK